MSKYKFTMHVSMQVQDWLKQAESVKALMSCTKMDQTPVASAENKGKKRKFFLRKIKIFKFLQKTD